MYVMANLVHLEEYDRLDDETELVDNVSNAP